MSAERKTSAGTPADNPFSLIPGASAGAGEPLRSWRLPLINGIAAAAVIGAIGFRLWEANLPPNVANEEVNVKQLSDGGLTFTIPVNSPKDRTPGITADLRIELRTWNN